MNNQKFCFSKSIGVLTGIVLLLILGTFTLTQLFKQQTSINTRATAPAPMVCRDGFATCGSITNPNCCDSTTQRCSSGKCVQKQLFSMDYLYGIQDMIKSTDNCIARGTNKIKISDGTCWSLGSLKAKIYGLPRDMGPTDICLNEQLEDSQCSTLERSYLVRAETGTKYGPPQGYSLIEMYSGYKGCHARGIDINMGIITATTKDANGTDNAADLPPEFTGNAGMYRYDGLKAVDSVLCTSHVCGNARYAKIDGQCYNLASRACTVAEYPRVTVPPGYIGSSGEVSQYACCSDVVDMSRCTKSDSSQKPQLWK